MRIAHAKSFTCAIYSTHVVLLTKRTDVYITRKLPGIDLNCLYGMGSTVFVFYCSLKKYGLTKFQVLIFIKGSYNPLTLDRLTKTSPFVGNLLYFTV